ncbi:unnamed protein product [Meganyctiphanes norvegica]|uniref:Uncharacterized protein n=1 Tax=Meganyctiphanes norvegica TaxID=48144 RepID=A0AAV2SV97_MEGNR
MLAEENKKNLFLHVWDIYCSISVIFVIFEIFSFSMCGKCKAEHTHMHFEDKLQNTKFFFFGILVPLRTHIQNFAHLNFFSSFFFPPKCSQLIMKKKNGPDPKNAHRSFFNIT